MKDKGLNSKKIPVIMINKTSVSGFKIFNPNKWRNRSKAIIQTCTTELSLIEHTASQLEVLCSSANDICNSYFKDLLEQWKKANWENSRCEYFVQVPEFHYLILVILCSIKGLLDAIVELLNSEKIVNSRVDGFHKNKDIIGGRVLNTLQNNAFASHKVKANRIYELIIDQKKNWIDEIVSLRDDFIHLKSGAHQVMLKMKILINDNQLVFEGAYPPKIQGKRIDLYFKEKVILLKEFSKSFLDGIKK